MGSPLAAFGPLPAGWPDVSGPVGGLTLWVDTYNGSSTNRFKGESLQTAYSTMEQAFDRIEAGSENGSRIYMRGYVREQLVAPKVPDVEIIGLSTRPRTSKALPLGPEIGAATWTKPASGATETNPLLRVVAQGWRVVNIDFGGSAGPTTAACIELFRDNGDGVDEDDASHFSSYGCFYAIAKYGILQSGGAGHVHLMGNRYAGHTTAALGSVTGAGVALPLRWHLDHEWFITNVSGAAGNASHIVMPLSCSLIENCRFGTVVSTGLYVDLTGGGNNIVGPNNLMMGNYATDDYVSASGDVWYGNRCQVTATTAPDGVSIQVPAA